MTQMTQILKKKKERAESHSTPDWSHLWTILRLFLARWCAFPYARPMGRRFPRALLLVTVIAGCSMLRAGRPESLNLDQMRERILASLDLQPGMKVAEIGIGPGWFVVRVAERIGANGIVYGTDIDEQRIAALRERLPQIGPGQVALRLCRDGRDTALDDLPDGHLDVVLMIDSLCFDAEYPLEQNVAYLRRFLRVLRPGGRLVHHMDCRCDVTLDGVAAQFAAAGFAPRFESFDVGHGPIESEPDWPCRSALERQRHAFVGVFRKP